MKLEINIDEELIQKKIEDLTALEAVKGDSFKIDYKIGLREGLEKGIKTYIYNKESEIIEKVVERATKRIVKKIEEDSILKMVIQKTKESESE